MKVIIEGRVTKCQEKTAKNGNKFYLSNVVCGEGTNYVNTEFVMSKNPVPEGLTQLPCSLSIDYQNKRYSLFTA